MMNGFADRKVYSVSEVTALSKSMLEGEFEGILLEGEVSNFKRHSSGHCYFSLKDGEAQIQAVMFGHYAAYLKFSLEDGLKVIVKGTVSIYEKSGRFQIVVSRAEPAGEGPLQVAFRQLKEKLEKEGLFSRELKKKIPLLVQNMAIVTSPTGAAIHDMLSVMERRFSNVHVLIYPVRVQGEEAPREIEEALKYLNEYHPGLDLIILSRGGGSMEDLQPFNEEIVARGIFASRIPVITAIGHEVDYTIADFVGDLRAPTPSAAIEIVLLNKADLNERLCAVTRKMVMCMEHAVGYHAGRMENVMKVRAFRRPCEFYERLSQSVDDTVERLVFALKNGVERKRQYFAALAGRLEALSPLSVLSRGYSLTMKMPEGRILLSGEEVAEGDVIRTMLKKGSIASKVIKTAD